MPKIVLNTRDELTILRMEQVAYLKADGNYTDVVYINNRKVTLLINISKLYEMITRVYPPAKCPFYRIGRSLIVNNAFLETISVPRERLILSDFQDNRIAIGLNKNALKQYKNAVIKARF